MTQGGTGAVVWREPFGESKGREPRLEKPCVGGKSAVPARSFLKHDSMKEASIGPTPPWGVGVGDP